MTSTDPKVGLVATSPPWNRSGPMQTAQHVSFSTPPPHPHSSHPHVSERELESMAGGVTHAVVTRAIPDIDAVRNAGPEWLFDVLHQLSGTSRMVVLMTLWLS